MALAPITAEDYYQSMLAVVNEVEQVGIARTRNELHTELRAMRELNLVNQLWVPVDETDRGRKLRDLILREAQRFKEGLITDRELQERIDGFLAT